MSCIATRVSSTLHRLAGSVLLLAAGSLTLAGSAVSATGVPKPVIESAKGGQCVEDAAFMRRNHMKLLKHQRVDTLRDGIRTGKHSLKACIDCHANKDTGSVAATETNFCQTCHNYVAVKIDCFECHSNKSQQKP